MRRWSWHDVAITRCDGCNRVYLAPDALSSLEVKARVGSTWKLLTEHRSDDMVAKGVREALFHVLAEVAIDMFSGS
jgi:hypothetical protein